MGLYMRLLVAGRRRPASLSLLVHDVGESRYCAEEDGGTRGSIPSQPSQGPCGDASGKGRLCSRSSDAMGRTMRGSGVKSRGTGTT